MNLRCRRRALAAVADWWARAVRQLCASTRTASVATHAAAQLLKVLPPPKHVPTVSEDSDDVDPTGT